MATDQRELFDRFITAINAPTSSLPRETLLGAITHFLSTMPIEQCRQLIRAVGTDFSLWQTSDDAESTREAVALGVQGARSRIDRAQAEGSRWYTIRWRRSAAADQWVQELLDEVKQVEGACKGDLLVALLKGIQGEQKARTGDGGCGTGTQREVQEEVVLALAPALDVKSSRDTVSAYGLLADIVELIDDELLSLLDLPRIAAWYRWDLFRRLDALSLPDDKLSVDASSHPAAHSMRIARAFGRVIQAMYTQPTNGRRNAAQCSLLDCIEAFQHYTRVAPTDPATRPHPILYSYIVIISAYVDAILAHPPPSNSSEARSDGRIARHALVALSHFASAVNSGRPTEGYERVLYGLLDVLVALEGCDGVSSLFTERLGPLDAKKIRMGEKELADADQGPEDAWWMTILESVCREVDAKAIESMRDVTQRRIRDPSHQPSFLAAHSLQIALLHAASDSAARAIRLAERASIDGDMADRCLHECAEYLKLLVEQYLSQAITADQLISAYPSIIADIARLDPCLVSSAHAPLDELDPHVSTASTSASGSDDTSRLVRLDILIASSPYVPIAEMKAYLDALSRVIDGLAQQADRRQRSRAVFDVIVKAFPDATRVLGIQWWDNWQASTSGNAARARL